MRNGQMKSRIELDEHQSQLDDRFDVVKYFPRDRIIDRYRFLAYRGDPRFRLRVSRLSRSSRSTRSRPEDTFLLRDDSSGANVVASLAAMTVSTR